MATPRTKLKIKMYEMGKTQKDLCKLLGRSESYVCARACCQKPWNFEEMKIIAKWLCIPLDNIWLLFDDAA